MKSWSCLYCPIKVSEIGVYVKLSSTTYSHRACYDQEQYKKFVLGQVKELAQKNADDAERQRIQAENVWRAAPRCPKCGVPMLSERPAGLPAEFSHVLSSNGSTCTLCVRQEAGLRAAARGREAPMPVPVVGRVTAAPNMRSASPEDEELVRKAKEAGTPAIEIE